MINKPREITVGDKTIDVDSLPKEIRDSIDFFDRIGEDISKVAYEHTVYSLAASAMKNKIAVDINQWFEKIHSEKDVKEEESIGESNE